MDIKRILEKINQFYREIRVELKKITWPPRKETLASTSVVLIITLIISFFLGIVDLGLSRIVKIILS